MKMIERSNSAFQLFGLVGFWWVLYIALIFFNDSTFAIKPILILTILSIILIYSNWSDLVKVIFYENYFEIRHRLSTKTEKCLYTEIIIAQVVFTRVVGNRLIVKFKTENGKLIKFSIYNPDKQLIEFLKNNVDNFDNRVG